MLLSRRSLLMGAGAAALVPTLSRAARAAGAHRLVVVLADGGWDSTFVFEPKLDVPDIDGPEVDEKRNDPDDVNVVSHYGDLAVCTNEGRRRNVTAFFDKWADRCCIVNGLLVGSIVHDFGRYRILTGTQLNTNPDVATITGHVLGANLPLGTVDTSGLSLPGSLGASAGRLGARNQIGYLLDPSLMPYPARSLGLDSFGGYAPDDAEAALLDQFLADRLAAAPTERARMQLQVDAMVEASDRAQRVVDSRHLILDEMRTGITQSLKQLADLSVNLLANDICSSVTIDSGFIWDTHSNNTSQHGNFNALFSPLDDLVQGLDDQGLLDTTIVAVVSEMSRTPKLNSGKGKDHWPTTSALLLGGPVRGGRVAGATDAGLEAMPVDFATGEVSSKGAILRYDNFAAGILAMLDIDPGDWYPGVEPFLGAM